MTTICVLSVWYVRGELPTLAFLPFGLIATALLFRIFSWHLRSPQAMARREAPRSCSCLLALFRAFLRQIRNVISPYYDIIIMIYHVIMYSLTIVLV